MGDSVTDVAALNPADPEHFRDGSIHRVLKRLRDEAPVQWCVSPIPQIGGYWSVTRYEDIVAVDSDHEAFSSEPAIVLPDPPEDFTMPMFIAMDPPKHGAQRKTVSPALSGPNLAHLAPLIRERTAAILDALPIGETFDWVDRVSVELTTMTLATLFDFPWEERRLLPYWSDVATSPDHSPIFTPGKGREERQAALMQCVGYFTKLWNERIAQPPKHDLISMLAHGEATRDMPRMEYLGNLILLIVGGNDTTRHTMTGSLLALHDFPEQERRLRENPDLLPAMVSEAIRWQTPLAYMRRTATRDVELGGQTIRKGEKVAMWYLSGNRDERAIERPGEFWIERPGVRRHLSYGFGIHRCVGNRLAELQLQIVWEEILARFPKIEVMGEPTRAFTSFVHGYETLPVRIPARL